MKPEPPEGMWDKLAEAESAAGYVTVTELEEGWFTRVEYSKQRGIPTGTAKDRLTRLVKVGVLETKTVNLRVGAGSPRTRIYRLQEKGCIVKK